MSLSAPGIDLGDVPTAGGAAGTYYAHAILPQTGTWEVAVSVRLTEFDNPVATIDFDVAAAEPAP